MRRYGIIGSILFGILILIGILLLFGTGSDLAITLILLLIPVMVIVSFFIIYLTEVRGKSIKTRVLERDLKRIAHNLIELLRELSNFENQYHIVTGGFRDELSAVKADLSSIGCLVNGEVHFDKAKLKKARSSDIEEIKLKIESIKDRYEPTIYGKVIEQGERYLDRLRELEAAGYRGIGDQMRRIEAMILEDIEIDILNLAHFLGDLTSIFDDAIESSLCEVKAVESGSKTIRDRSRIRTDIKIAEQNMERGNYDAAAGILRNVMERIIDETADGFNQYKEMLLEMVGVVKKVADGEKVRAIEAKIEHTDSPSQQNILKECEAELRVTAIETLEAIYENIFDLEAKIRDKEPSSEEYPVDYWGADRMQDVLDLQTIEQLGEFMLRYEALIEDANSRLEYDRDRLDVISK
ncbi:MAG: hypothetical protein OCU18_00355 [Candidatus Syntrophoarchaeum sp.]|nr:hypothetical protein [Candidatus Syntrophoarchaeum sp.]